MERFYLDEYFAGLSGNAVREESIQTKDFEALCAEIYADFMREWDEESDNPDKLIEIQKRAITGYAPEVSYFLGKIREYLSLHGLEKTDFPGYYETLEEAVYHENWGVASLAEWFSAKYAESSSAKVIGDRVYFMENGRMTLKPQRIGRERREQLIRAFLMLTPQERLDKDFHEVYLLDGTRITIFKRRMVKENQDVIILRRYIVPSYTFDEQIARGTIPEESRELFINMVKLGYNVAFCGAVRTAKTTFLSTWQSYESSELEGVMVETDPEIHMEKLMPEAPIVQLIADGENLAAITKNLLRSDADYFILAEARDGVALDTAIRTAAKGTRRLKITFHTRDPRNFPYDVAGEIVNTYGGNIGFTARRAASAFDYVFHFVQLPDKSKKRLRSIYEMRYDRESDRIVTECICDYDFESDSWNWNYIISDEKRAAGMEEDREAFFAFEKKLKELANENNR